VFLNQFLPLALSKQGADLDNVLKEKEQRKIPLLFRVYFLNLNIFQVDECVHRKIESDLP
jgi:hypothetical protein